VEILKSIYVSRFSGVVDFEGSIRLEGLVEIVEGGLSKFRKSRGFENDSLEAVGLDGCELLSKVFVNDKSRSEIQTVLELRDSFLRWSIDKRFHFIFLSVLSRNVFLIVYFLLV